MNRILNVALAAALAAGCVVEVTFDPIGGDAAIDGSWTINGEAPTAANCNALGIADVQLQIYEQFGSEFYTDSTLRASCATGSFTTGPFLVADTYRFRWTALDSSGAIIGMSGFETVTVTRGGTATLVNDFTDGMMMGFDPRGTDVELIGEWLINGGAADAVTCDSVGLSTVVLRIYNQDETESFDFDFDCAVGGFAAGAGPVLAAGSYNSQWLGLAVDDTVLGETDTAPLVVTGPTATLLTPDFALDPIGFDPRGSDVTLAGEWLLNGFVADATYCDNAGIATIALRIYDATGTESFDFDFNCADGGFDTSAAGSDPILALGTYTYQWLALQSDETIVGMTDEIALDATIAGHADLDVPDFTISNTLQLNLQFEANLGSADYTDCDGALVDTITYTVQETGGGAVIASGAEEACTETLEFLDVPVGDYDVLLTADAGAGTKWGSADHETPDFVVVEVGLESYDCFFDQT